MASPRKVSLSVFIIALSCFCVACDPPPERNPALFSDTEAMPLAEAIADDDAESVRKHLREGANPNTKGEYGTTLLQFAISCRSESSLEALLEGGANPNAPGDGADTAVHTAAITPDPVFLRLILENGGDPDARNGVTNGTPLAQVILFPDRADEQFRMLLDAGADVNAKNDLNDTPLHVAGRVNAGAKILTMLEAGADPRARNDSGATFQEYYFGYNEAILNDKAKRERKEIKAWLRENDVPIWNPPPPEETTETT
jgi:uncharacterized protein